MTVQKHWNEAAGSLAMFKDLPGFTPLVPTLPTSPKPNVLKLNRIVIGFMTYLASKPYTRYGLVKTRQKLVSVLFCSEVFACLTYPFFWWRTGTWECSSVYPGYFEIHGHDLEANFRWPVSVGNLWLAYRGVCFSDSQTTTKWCLSLPQWFFLAAI